MNNNTLKKFVEAGYKKKSEAKQIDDYILDEELSTKRNKVYYNPTTGKAIHTIAGTDSAYDWTNNALIPLGMHEYSNRYKNSESIQKKVNKKYGASNVDLVSHSQSGNIAENLANKNLVGGANTTLNPAIIGSHNKNIKVVKSAFDPVSLLTNTNKNDNIVTPKSFNPIVEHSTNILDKTQDNVFQPVTDAFQPVTDVANKTQKKINKFFGFGIRPLKKSNVNKSMKDKYDSDSSSDDEMEGCGIDEQKILKKMGSLHKDIAKLHQKHGVKKSVIKGFKMLGMGIINGCGKINSILDNDDGTPYEPSNSIELYTPEQEASYKSYMSKYKSGRGVSKQAKWDSMPRYDPNNPVYTTMPQGTVSAPIKIKGGAMPRYDPYNPVYTTMPVNRTPKKFKFEGGELFSTAGFDKKGGRDGMTKQETKEKQDRQNYSDTEKKKDAKLALAVLGNSGYSIKGYGANGKMLKNAAANATAGLISSGSARAIHEMDTRGKKGAGFKKGSQEAKDHMARIRAMRKTK